jgi:hypothetical protein
MIIDKSERSDEFDLISKHDASKKNKVSGSLIPVIYFDNSPGKVKPDELDELIKKRMIISFRRSNEWVRVTGDPLREKGRKYEGPDRRKR